MKILMLAGKAPDTQSFSSGWFNALSTLGEGKKHQVEVWSGLEAAFDCFDRVKPDLIWTHSRDLTREFVRAAIDSQQKIILFLNDSKLASAKEKEFVSQIVKAGHTKVFSACFPELLSSEELSWKETDKNMRVLSCLPAADITRYKPVPANPLHAADISLIACYEFGKQANLSKYVYPLLQDFDLKIYGYGQWPSANYLGSLNKEMFNTVICSSKINMSVSSENCIFPSERIFKILACGKVPLVHRANKFTSNIFHWGYYFSNLCEAFEHIQCMLEYPFEDIKNSMKHIHNNHTYAHRVNQVFHELEIK